MARPRHHIPPESLVQVLGEDGYRYLLELHRFVYGDTADEDGVLDRDNIRPVENLKTGELNAGRVLEAVGDTSLRFTSRLEDEVLAFAYWNEDDPIIFH